MHMTYELLSTASVIHLQSPAYFNDKIILSMHIHEHYKYPPSTIVDKANLHKPHSLQIGLL